MKSPTTCTRGLHRAALHTHRSPIGRVEASPDLVRVSKPFTCPSLSEKPSPPP